MKKVRVLVVDDSPFFQNILKRALSSDKCEVCGVGGNGREAVDLYFSQKPDVVLMDMTMPEMDGMEAAQAIHSRDPEAKIIILSATGDEALVEQAKSLGVGMFLSKTSKPEQILEAVEKMAA